MWLRILKLTLVTAALRDTLTDAQPQDHLSCPFLLLAVDFDVMAERLRTLLESQRQLLRDVSHELRSPLARLQIALGLARRPHANLEQEFDRILAGHDAAHSNDRDIYCLRNLPDHPQSDRLDRGARESASDVCQSELTSLNVD